MLQSLLLTALGGVLGGGGALLASQWQAREARRIRKEQDAREDRYRLINERVRAYRAFFVAAGSARHAITHQASPEEAMEARIALWEAFTLVALIGEHNTWDQARTLLEMVSAVTLEGSAFNVDEWNEQIRGFVQASRLDLIPARLADVGNG